jgi:hypothetical protein
MYVHVHAVIDPSIHLSIYPHPSWWLEVFKLSLGVAEVELPDEKGKPEKVSVMDLVGGDRACLRTWRGLTKAEKLEQLSVDAQDVVDILQGPEK